MPIFGAKVGVGVISTKPYGLRVGTGVPRRQLGLAIKRRKWRLSDNTVDSYYWSSDPHPVSTPCPFHSYLCRFFLLIRTECRDSGKSDGIVSLCSSNWTEPSELPLGWCHSQELNLDPKLLLKWGFLVAIFGKKRWIFFIHRTRTGPN